MSKIKRAIMYRIPRFTLMLIRDSSLKSEVKRIETVESALKILQPEFKNLDREHFKVLILDSNSAVIGIHTVTIGVLSHTLIHPREVFKPAILSSAASIIISHNHPSGNSEPSKEDLKITKQLVNAGKIIGIPVVDHLILTDDGRYTSFAERNLL